jgi:hypothetical protein
VHHKLNTTQGTQVLTIAIEKIQLMKSPLHADLHINNGTPDAMRAVITKYQDTFNRDNIMGLVKKNAVDSLQEDPATHQNLPHALTFGCGKSRLSLGSH